MRKIKLTFFTTYKAITASYLGERQIKEVLNITFGTIVDNDISFALWRNPLDHLHQAPKYGHNHAMHCIDISPLRTVHSTLDLEKPLN